MIFLQVISTVLVLAVFTVIPAAAVKYINDIPFWEAYRECAKIVGWFAVLLAALAGSIMLTIYMWSL